MILALPSATQAQPVVQMTEMSHDMGVIQGMEQVEHVFEVKNTGDQDLVIERLSPS